MKFSQWCNKVTIFRGVRPCSLVYGYVGLEGCVSDYECTCLPTYQTTQWQYAGVRKLITLHCNRFEVKYATKRCYLIHKENPTRCNSVPKFYFIFIWRSICFGRHTAHHQKPKTAEAASGFAYVKGYFAQEYKLCDLDLCIWRNAFLT